MLTIKVIFKDNKCIKIQNITKYSIQDNVLLIEQTLFHSQGKRTDYCNKYISLFNILYFDIYDEKEIKSVKDMLNENLKA